MNEPSLFDPVPDPDCAMCWGHGRYRRYEHGKPPELWTWLRCPCTKKKDEA